MEMRGCGTSFKKNLYFIIIWMMYEKKYILTKAWPGLKNALTSWLGGITVFLLDPSASFWIASQMGMGGPWTPQQHTGAISVGVWHPLWLLPSDTIFSSETNWGWEPKEWQLSFLAVIWAIQIVAKSLRAEPVTENAESKPFRGHPYGWASRFSDRLHSSCDL
jgi:hypothetical protein